MPDKLAASPAIIVVEDDEDIRETVLYALRSAGFTARGFENGGDFFHALSQGARAALVLLDVMLPGDDGLNILKRLRQSPETKALPVIMLTAKGGELDKVKGLDSGADDYITKPFGVLELISRINAVLRRSGGDSGDCLSYKKIALDNDRRAVTVDGVAVPLTFKEYELLYYLMLNERRALSREKIIQNVWGYDFEGESRSLDMHVRTLRRKLGAGGEYIKTVRGVGYKLGE